MAGFEDLISRHKTYLVAAFLWFGACGEGYAREGYPRSKGSSGANYHETVAETRPRLLYAAHNRGKMQLAVANNGTFGTSGGDIQDPITGKRVLSCIYPKGSDLVYLWVGAFWIGAVVGRDTLVSVGTEDFYITDEFWSDTPPFDEIQYRSLDINSQFYSPDALSEEDILVEYADTNRTAGLVAQDPTDQRPHIPLNIKVQQRSMAWSYNYADDFVLFDYQIENIGLKRLRDVYMGIWVDGDVWHTSRYGPEGWNDDIVGFLHTFPAAEGCGFEDTVNIAYHADNDGDPIGSSWDYRSPRHAVGARVVRTPSESLSYSFNWWIIDYGGTAHDFGPRRRETTTDRFRDFGGRLGTPLGDRNKYYILKHKEFDYDLLFTGVDHSAQGWLPPPVGAADLARGWDARYLLSFGPFNIDPGQRLPISFAWVGGQNLHSNPENFKKSFNPSDPELFYKTLDFSDLAANSRWSSWIYDNPGLDTDDDKYAGKFRICVRDSVLDRIDTLDRGGVIIIDSIYRAVLADTTYYEGDGVPDFRGASPPPAPRLRVIARDGELVVRWNGYYSENTPDVFLRRIDFEGYKVYISRDERPSSFSLLISHDRENYNRTYLRHVRNDSVAWVMEDVPFNIDSLRAMYGDSAFAPLNYSSARPLVRGDSLYYFTPTGYNLSDLSDNPGNIHRAYPGLTRPPTDSSSWTDEEVTYEHGARLPKFYEYEYRVPNLLRTIPYYVAVTAFDYGSQRAGLTSLETNPLNNMIREFPMVTADSVEALNLNAYVYPNPYRSDDNYEENGFEVREPLVPSGRMHRIHFANLPRICTISIYSLDGDLIRVLHHNYPAGGVGSMHESWDVVSRNNQEVVSGIYYWVIESSTRTQLGKFVIIR